MKFNSSKQNKQLNLELKLNLKQRDGFSVGGGVDLVGGPNSRGGYISKTLCVETKESRSPRSANAFGILHQNVGPMEVKVCAHLCAGHRLMNVNF